MTEVSGRVLIVDDDRQVCEVLSEFLELEGLLPEIVHDGQSALQSITREAPDVVLLDIRMPGLDGMEVLRRVRRMDPDLPVVMISGSAGIQTAVDAIRLGAQDFITKPCRQADVFRAVYRALKDRSMSRRVRQLSARLLEASSLPELMGPSSEVARIAEEVQRVGPSNFSVVVTGETGTGKELVARAIHQAGGEEGRPFVAVDCGAIPETLFEAELFGHEKGAFTGAERLRPGKFELAHSGTLFLDEVANLPLSCQAKLLRALQEKRIQRVGGSEPIEVETRLISASNRGLGPEAAEGRFRMDLYYRLNEFALDIPPLRERRQDILFLAKRFLDLTSFELNKTVRGFSTPALEILMRSDWPGNVRELRSVIRRAVLLTDELIDVQHLGHLSEAQASVPDAAPLREEEGQDLRPLREQVSEAVESVERRALTRALRLAEGNKAKAARILKIDYKTIHTKLKRLGLADTWKLTDREPEPASRTDTPAGSGPDSPRGS